MFKPAQTPSRLAGLTCAGSEQETALRNPGAERTKRILFAAFTAAPILFVSLVVLRYAVDVPYLDQWDLVPLLDKAFAGRLTLGELWVPHNEHRIFFPQLIILGLARLTHWNIYYELGANLALALALFAILAWQCRMTARALFIRDWYQVLPAISVVVFSNSQYQNWLWGFQSALFLNMLAATGGLLLLAQRTFSWTRFVVAAGLGVVATFSFATGVIFWPIGLVLILLMGKTGKQRTVRVLGWLAMSALALGLFFSHYFAPRGSPPVATALTMPLECARFLLKYMGAIAAQFPGGDVSTEGKFALIFGMAALPATGWAAWKLIRSRTIEFPILLPYLGIASYCLGGGALAALGRVCLGSDQAASSRYSTMVVPFWSSLVVFLFLLLRAGTDTAAAKPSRGTNAARWCLGGVILLLVLGSGLALDGASRLSTRQAAGRIALLSLAKNPAEKVDYRPLFALHPELAVVVERYPVLKAHRLSLFRDETSPHLDQ